MDDKKKIEAYDNLVSIFAQYDGGLHKYVDDLFCGRLYEHKVIDAIKARIKELDARIKSFERKASYSKIHDSLALEYTYRKLELEKVLDKDRWTDKHTKIVEESEEMFKTHTEGEEIDI